MGLEERGRGPTLEAFGWTCGRMSAWVMDEGASSWGRHEEARYPSVPGSPCWTAVARERGGESLLRFLSLLPLKLAAA